MTYLGMQLDVLLTPTRVNQSIPYSGFVHAIINIISSFGNHKIL